MKKYHVCVQSVVDAVRVVEAESPEEALKIVDAEMKESIARMIRDAEVRDDVIQISGRAGATGVVDRTLCP